MSEQIYAGLTSQSVDIFIQDSSSSIGAGLSGLVYNTAGLVASYRKGTTGSRVAITLATQTVGGAYSSGGFVEIDSTNMKGVYRFDIPNAAVDTEGFVTIYLYGAANMVPCVQRIDCRALRSNVKLVNDIAASGQSGVLWSDLRYINGYNASGSNGYVAIDTLPTMPSGWITDSGVSASAVTKIQNGLSTLTSTNVQSIVQSGVTDTKASQSGNAQSGAYVAMLSLYLDKLFASTYSPSGKPGDSGALLNSLIGSGATQFTSTALALVPVSSGGSSSGDWTSTEKANIRYVLGVDGTQTAPTGSPNSLFPANITYIKGISASGQSGVLWSDLRYINGIPASGTGSVTVDAESVRSAVGLASANLDTQLGDIPTTSEFNARTLPSGQYFDPNTDIVIINTLPTMPSGWITDSGISTAAVIKIQNGLSTLTSGTVQTIVDIGVASGAAAQSGNARLGSDTALRNLYLDRLFANPYSATSKPGSGTALLNTLVDSASTRFSQIALELAPQGSGGGGSGDWTSTEKAQIRYVLGVDGTTVTPTGNPNATFNSNITRILGISASGQSGVLWSDQRFTFGNSTSTQNQNLFFTSGYNASGSTVGTVTTLTNIPTGVATAVGLTTTETNLTTTINNRTLASGNYASSGIVRIIVQSGVDDVKVAQSGNAYLGSLTAINFYDPPTRTELTTDKNEIIASGITEARVRSAVGLASANLDTQLGDIPTVTEFNARTLPSGQYFNPTEDTVATVTTLTNLPAITANWLTAAGLAADAVAEIQSGLSTLSSGNVQSIVQSGVTAVQGTQASNAQIGASGALQAYDAPTRAELTSDKNEIISYMSNSGVHVVTVSSGAFQDVFETYALTEAYPVDGATATPAEMMYFLKQVFSEFVISGTTITVKKLDKSTTAATFGTNSASNPTSRTRAT